MSDVRAATTALLADRPALADALDTLVEVDRSQDTWTFDDAPVDSGVFGELVGRGIVVESGDGYVLADRQAVRAALGDPDADPSDADGAAVSLRDRVPSPSVSSRAAWFLAASLLVVVALRVFVFPRVFRAGHVVLLGNDPYYYRYLVSAMQQSGAGLLDVPARIARGEPLLVVVLVGATRLLGGSASAAAHVTAWYPVVAAVVTAVACYLLATTLSHDRRVGITAVLVLAVLPVHAYRTALGFGDHHALDLVWLSLTVLAAVRLLPGAGVAVPDDSGWRRHLPWGCVLAGSVAAQAHSWNAAPLLFVPLVVYAVARSAALVDDKSALADLPLAAALTAGGVLAVAGHVLLGWQSPVIVAPPLLAGLGVGAAALIAAGVRRVGVPSWTAPVLTTASGVAAFAVVATIDPSFVAELQQEGARFVGQSGSSIVETKSLFSTTYGLFAGPIFFYGTALLFALPAGAWAVYTGVARSRPRWLLTGCYGTVLLAFAVTQVRFSGELSVFVAVFAAVAFVYFLSVVDLADPPLDFSARSSDRERVRSLAIPTRSRALRIGVAFLLVGGLGAVMTPLRTNTLVQSDDAYHAATHVEAALNAPDWTDDTTYVFSRWSRNRLYNWFGSGDGRSYRYARSNYDDFLRSTTPGKWSDRLQDRAAFVVFDANSVPDGATGTIGSALTAWGSGLAHYRAVWAGDAKTVYRVVPGATVTGTAASNASVTLTHEGTVSGQAVTYTRTTTAAANGTYTVTVAYPGAYSVSTGGTVTVPAAAVGNGTTVSA
ncbi:STT3 domain-containing protein [Halobacterium salinarum]|uniref:STT3 domain-containing protein n=1 Tax=Halobacterium salinarum TaxID=2242 RepID=UPI00255689EB|nr:STT3 domain-containing protein [Halobacterium salinarum]MDL0126553.1 hypothetical protein [Halobacterium salinarum]